MSQQNRPSLLLVSHCVPSPLGHAQRARAWQLLRLASRTHRVTLVSLEDAPVRFDQWRSLQAAAERVVIERRGITGLLGRQALVKRLTRDIGGHISGTRFDALICTHPMLKPVAQRVACDVRVCDLGHGEGQLQDTVAYIGPASDRRSGVRGSRGRGIADTFNVYLSADAMRDAGAHGHGIVALPMMVEDAVVDQTAHDATGDAATSRRVLIHTDWSEPTAAAAAALRWFRAAVWPAVREAVPDATLLTTRGLDPTATLDALGGAAVVVAPDRDARSPWPVLQAMAMQRAVIASPHFMDRYDTISNGVELILPRHRQAWIDGCILTLRDTGLRAQIARNGWSWLACNATIDRCANPLAAVLHGHTTPAHAGLALAA